MRIFSTEAIKFIRGEMGRYPDVIASTMPKELKAYHLSRVMMVWNGLNAFNEVRDSNELFTSTYELVMELLTAGGPFTCGCEELTADGAIRHSFSCPQHGI